MKKFFTYLSITFLVTVNLSAQSNDLTNKNRVTGFSTALGAGYSQLSTSGLNLLNQKLQKYNYAQVRSQFSTWNLDLIHALYKNNVFNFSIGGAIKRNTISDSSKTTFSSFYGTASVGRVLYHSDKLIIYPLVGINFGDGMVHSHYTGFYKASEISGTDNYKALDFSLNLDYIFNGIRKKINSEQDQDMPGTGVFTFSIGYIFCPVNTYWNDNNYDASSKFNGSVNYPPTVIGSTTSSNFSMFYTSLKFGFGTFSKR